MAFKKVYEGNQVEVFEVAENVYFRKASLYGRSQCNGAYFVNETGVAIVDVPPEALEMVDEVQTLFNKPIRQIFVTHAHFDHFVDIPKFYDMDVEIFCSRRVAELITPAIKGHKASVVGVDGTIPLRLSGGMEVELLTLPDVTHSKWDMFIRLPEHGILCTGDAVVECRSSFFHDADIGGWINMMKRLSSMPGKLIFPGHGDEPFEYSYLNDFRTYLEAVERCANVCYISIANDGSGDIPNWAAYSSVSVDKVKDVVEAFFQKQSDDAKFLEGCTGVPDSRRVVRMVLWNILRQVLV